MIIHPHHTDMRLFEVADLDGTSGLPGVDPAATLVLEWARSYLSAPHPDLGRPGPVCPYVPSSLRDSLFYISVQPGRPDDPTEVAAAVERYRDWFMQLEPTSGREAQLKTILLLFPDLELARAPELIDITQQVLKPLFVAAGLMIGQFHPTPPDQAGLWNEDFRPLRSPVPLLAIRHMVPSDLPFLVHDRQLVASYLQQFAAAVPARCTDQLAAAVAALGLELPSCPVSDPALRKVA